MPANVVIVNGQEFIVPDSWMPVLSAYLQLMQSKTESDRHQHTDPRQLQIDPTPSQPFSLLKRSSSEETKDDNSK